MYSARGWNSFSRATSSGSGWVTRNAHIRCSPTAIICAPRWLMWVGEPPPIMASRRRGKRGPVFVHSLRRRNIAPIPGHACRS